MAPTRRREVLTKSPCVEVERGLEDQRGQEDEEYRFRCDLESTNGREEADTVRQRGEQRTCDHERDGEGDLESLRERAQRCCDDHQTHQRTHHGDDGARVPGCLSGRLTTL